jgi:hypothetical protein
VSEIDSVSLKGAFQKYRKVVVIAVILSVQLLLLHKYFAPSRHTSRGVEQTTVRPPNFPDVLVAPDNAYDVLYSSPSGSSALAGTYYMSFRIREPFPGTESRAGIEEHLRSQGWRKLMFDLLNPQFLHTDSWNPQADETGKMVGKFMIQDWLNQKGESIRVIHAYGLDLQSNLDHLYVTIFFYEQYAWPREFIELYRQHHPTEFPVKQE